MTKWDEIKNREFSPSEVQKEIERLQKLLEAAKIDAKYRDDVIQGWAAENAALRDAMALGADDLVPTDLWGKAPVQDLTAVYRAARRTSGALCAATPTCSRPLTGRSRGRRRPPTAKR
jgi:hypothetical protein